MSELDYFSFYNPETSKKVEVGGKKFLRESLDLLKQRIEYKQTHQQKDLKELEKKKNKTHKS